MLIKLYAIRFVWWVYLWSILSIEFINTTNETESNQICHSLAKDEDEAQGTNELNILAIGLTRKNFLLITRNFYVYEMSKESFDSSTNKLYLNATPIPMSVKFPTLFESSDFNKIKTKSFTVFILIRKNDDSDLLFITPWKKETRVNGLTFNLINHGIQEGIHFSQEFKELAISSDEYATFYTLHHSNTTNGLEIALYYCIFLGNCDLKNTFRLICYGDKHKQTIIIKNYDEICENDPVKWPITTGFVANNHFYLFEKNYVLIFSADAYSEANKAVPIEKRKLSSFFICSETSFLGK